MDPFFDLDELAFHAPLSPDLRAHARERIDRPETLCAYQGDRPVGTSAVFRQPLSIPGGRLDCGAVSWVAVASTHRRRGILSTMIEGQLTRLVQAGVPLAALWSSEATIYGRFGFGIATSAHSYDIRTRERDSGLAHPGRGVALALIDPSTAHDVLADVYDRAASQRAGVLGRDERWWIHDVLADHDEDRQGGRLRVLVAGDPPSGYAIYRAGDDDTAPHSPGLLTVRELVAIDHEATLALWSYLLSVDLIGRVSAPLRPSDDPLSLMLTNPRTAERRATDGLWIRLLDLPRALSSRHWNEPFELVLDVADDLIADNAGRWLLRHHDGHTGCVRTDRPADLALTVAQLATVYLGGGSLVQARDAGLLDEPTPGAAERLDRAARTARAPWNVAVF